MPTVTPPSISALPAAPDPNDRSTFNGRAYPWSAALPTFGTQVSAVATNVKANADDAAASATAASGFVATVAASAAAAAQSVADAAVQVGIAQGAANNKGNWSALTGALNMPASVVHNGKIWVLRVNLADVTTSTPGTNSDWLDLASAGAESPYAGTLAQVNVPLTTNSTHILNAVVVVDANRTLLLTRSLSGAHAVVYDKATGTCGAAVLVRSGTNSFPQGILCGTDKVLVCSCLQNTTALEAVVLSLSGTSIIVNTAATRTLVENAFSLNDPPILVGSSYVFGVARSANASAFAVTVSGTTPTIGAAVNSHAGTDNQRLRLVDSTRFLLVSRDTGTLIYATPYTVSGSTLTKGTSATFTGSSVQTVASLASGRFAVVYSNTATWGAIVTVASTTATATTVQLGTGATVDGGGTKVGGNQLIVAASANEVNVLSDVSGTATSGAAIAVRPGPSTLASPIGFGPDYVSFCFDSGGNYSLSTIKISGNNPVLRSAGSTHVPCLPGGDSSVMTTGAPSDVLSIAGKSMRVAGSAGAAAYAIDCGTGYKTRILHPVFNAHIKESDAVIWTASSSPAALISFSRLELT